MNFCVKDPARPNLGLESLDLAEEAAAAGRDGLAAVTSWASFCNSWSKRAVSAGFCGSEGRGGDDDEKGSDSVMLAMAWSTAAVSLVCDRGVTGAVMEVEGLIIMAPVVVANRGSKPINELLFL